MRGPVLDASGKPQAEGEAQPSAGSARPCGPAAAVPEADPLGFGEPEAEVEAETDAPGLPEEAPGEALPPGKESPPPVRQWAAPPVGVAAGEQSAAFRPAVLEQAASTASTSNPTTTPISSTRRSRGPGGAGLPGGAGTRDIGISSLRSE